MANRSDNFSGSGTLNGRTPSDGLSPWTSSYSDMTISGGKATPAGNSFSLFELDAGVADGTTAVTIATPTTTAATFWNGLYFRGDAAFANGFVFFLNTDGAQLHRLVSGGLTQIGSTNASFPSTSAPFTLSVVTSGTSLICKVGGSTAFSVTDSASQTNTRFGLLAHNDPASGFSNFSFIDGQVASLAAGSISSASAVSATSVTASAASGGTAPYTYQWYGSQSSGFTPGAGNLLAGQTGQNLSGYPAAAGSTWYFIRKATDSASATALTPEYTYSAASGSGSGGRMIIGG
jgi:hypothetical protein